MCQKVNNWDMLSLHKEYPHTTTESQPYIVPSTVKAFASSLYLPPIIVDSLAVFLSGTTLAQLYFSFSVVI